MNNKLNLEYILDGNQKATILNFLEGNITSREAGKIIGLSHQQIINMSTNLIRSWVKTKKVELNSSKIFPSNLTPSNLTPNT